MKSGLCSSMYWYKNQPDVCVTLRLHVGVSVVEVVVVVGIEVTSFLPIDKGVSVVLVTNDVSNSDALDNSVRSEISSSVELDVCIGASVVLCVEPMLLIVSFLESA